MFRAVKGCVGITQKILWLLATIGDSDADRRGDDSGLLADLDRLGKGLAKSTGRNDRVATPQHVADHHRELITAEPGDDVAGADHRADSFRDLV